MNAKFTTNTENLIRSLHRLHTHFERAYVYNTEHNYIYYYYNHLHTILCITITVQLYLNK